MEQQTKGTPLGGFFRAVEKIENAVVGLALFGVFLVVLIQIVGRVIGRPAPWTEEGTRYLFLWMMFIALATGFNKAESSRVTVFLSIMPAFLKKNSKYLYIVVDLLFFFFILLFGMELVRQQIAMNEMGTAILIPMYLVGLCTPLCGLCGIIGIIRCVIETPHLIEIDSPGGEKK